jgi:hypothetical protein
MLPLMTMMRMQGRNVDLSMLHICDGERVGDCEGEFGGD